QQLAVDQQRTILRMQEAELALADSEERLRLALAASRSATFEIDVASGRMTWSEGVGPLVGRPEGTSPDTVDEALEHVEPAYRTRVASAITTAKSGAGHGALEVRAPRTDGGVTWLALTWVSRPDADGVVRRVVGTMTDISERKRLEEQFLHAQKMQAMGSLAGGVAHDFNNLLTVIIGAGQMARRAADAPGMPEELRTDLNEVLSAGQRAAALTGQLLAFSRGQVVQPRHFDLCVLIGSIEAMLRRLVGEGVQIETALPGASIPVFADQGQLSQVVMNLVINARDAMPSGGTLRIAVRTDGRPGGLPMPEESLHAERYAVLSVSDGGVGIAPEILPQIFHPFFTTKPVGQGTGLGLATVYGIVMQLGGTVRVQSKVGHGATFDIYIPFDDDALVEPDVAPTIAVQPAGDGRTVLLAEDEPGLRKLTERVLTEAGYRVLVAPDGSAALAMSRAHSGPIDLLITDVVMPGLGGPDLAVALRAERPALRVLLVSGYPRSTTSAGEPDLARLPFLAKPFLPGELRAAAAQALAEG
ncbi:MAG: response regulator, partial [Gemmatimonadetes bacterium]|nr:response regulator [Gemmatimonadota bacterium]